MRRSAIVLVVLLLALGLVVPIAGAAPGDHGHGFGGCVDALHGNATNPRPSGHGVIPSQSPGPWVNNPLDPDNPTWGFSMGDAQKLGRSFGLNGRQTLEAGCSLF